MAAPWTDGDDRLLVAEDAHVPGHTVADLAEAGGRIGFFRAPPAPGVPDR